MEDQRETRLEDLPASIPVFPLPGALLLPRWRLPLNIFEPRYLNMIDDAMGAGRWIGMVQTTGGDRAHPTLASIGCVGKITDYSETDDGRYQIILTGLIRYRIEAELDAPIPYRTAQVNFAPFQGDLARPVAFSTPNRDAIIAALKPYAAACGLEANWDALEGSGMEDIVNALCTGCPFDVMEKQALLEAPDLQARAKMLIQLMQINASQANKDGGQNLQ